MGRLGSFSHASGRGKLYFATLRDGEKNTIKKNKPWTGCVCLQWWGSCMRRGEFMKGIAAQCKTCTYSSIDYKTIALLHMLTRQV